MIGDKSGLSYADLSEGWIGNDATLGLAWDKQAR